ncbi:hypothetical protein BKA82DRAFT_2542501 [Pisolithus tinctorius]|nr:hypothetical protein BKA82DRAFT_2542501 [Pisolithus tinctorius]
MPAESTASQSSPKGEERIPPFQKLDRLGQTSVWTLHTPKEVFPRRLPLVATIAPLACFGVWSYTAYFPSKEVASLLSICSPLFMTPFRWPVQTERSVFRPLPYHSPLYGGAQGTGAFCWMQFFGESPGVPEPSFHRRPLGFELTGVDFGESNLFDSIFTRGLRLLSRPHFLHTYLHKRRRN